MTRARPPEIIVEIDELVVDGRLGRAQLEAAVARRLAGLLGATPVGGAAAAVGAQAGHEVAQATARTQGPQGKR